MIEACAQSSSSLGIQLCVNSRPVGGPEPAYRLTTTVVGHVRVGKTQEESTTCTETEQVAGAGDRTQTHDNADDDPEERISHDMETSHSIETQPVDTAKTSATQELGELGTRSDAPKQEDSEN